MAFRLIINSYSLIPIERINHASCFDAENTKVTSLGPFPGREASHAQTQWAPIKRCRQQPLGGGKGRRRRKYKRGKIWESSSFTTSSSSSSSSPKQPLGKCEETFPATESGLSYDSCLNDCFFLPKTALLYEHCFSGYSCFLVASCATISVVACSDRVTFLRVCRGGNHATNIKK